ncbi:hypothetical protein KF840_00325 [bacterium]|nr:hypothetical protein [bacterium]
MLPTAILALLALAAPVAPLARDASPRGRFIIGSPERPAMVGDHQEPRRYERVESAVGAYADIDEVGDAAWLRHELEGYARRASACAARPRERCAVGARRVAGATVIHLIRGAHAEILWTSARRAVRLGWRRLVDTPTGTMTVDDPPADFAAALLAELPSDLSPADLDAGRWADDEVDRRLDYAERVLAGCAVATDTAGCLHFARASLLALETDAPPDGAAVDPAAEPTASLRLRIAAARLRRAAARQSPLVPWCAAPGSLAPPQRLAALP